jgi:hypothetical protein
MTRVPGTLPAILLAAALIVRPLPARAQTGTASGADRIRFGGSLRTLGAGVQGRTATGSAAPGEGGLFDQTVLRVTAEGRPAEWMAFEFHLVQSYAYSSAVTGLEAASPGGFGLVAGDTRYRALDATADWRSRRQAASLWVDRSNVKLTLPGADVTIGRQAISFGKAYFWNPLDEFLPFDARQVDRDYKAGIDGLRLDVPHGPFSGVNLVAAAGRELTPEGAYRGGPATAGVSWYGSAVLARYFTTRHGWDVSAQGGKVYGGYQLGGGVVGELQLLEIRGEAAYLWAMPSLPLPQPLSGPLIDDHFMFVGGVGKRFPNTLWIELEHFHNGAGDPRHPDAALVRFLSGASLNMGREITGMTFSYDVLPLLTGQLAALHSWSDGSSQIQPTFTYALSGNGDLVAGMAVGIGPAPLAGEGAPARLRSEFGSFPRAYFAELKLYF